MTALVVVLLLRPLLRRGKEQLAGGAEEMAVYRAQLDEIENDLAAGTLPQDEAINLRREAERRLLAADEASRAAVASGKPAKKAAIGVLLFVLVAAPGTYLVLGSPDEPSQPHAEREDVEMQRALQERTARLRADLAENPGNSEGWQELALMRTMLGQPGAAAAAYRQALLAGGEDAAVYASLAEALVAQARGEVTPEARQALGRALDINPNEVLALYYVGHALEQDGRFQLALTLWQDLEAVMPEGSRWRARVGRDIARVAPKAEASQ